MKPPAPSARRSGRPGYPEAHPPGTFGPTPPGSSSPYCPFRGPGPFRAAQPLQPVLQPLTYPARRGPVGSKPSSGEGMERARAGGGEPPRPAENLDSAPGRDQGPPRPPAWIPSSPPTPAPDQDRGGGRLAASHHEARSAPGGARTPACRKRKGALHLRGETPGHLHASTGKEEGSSLVCIPGPFWRERGDGGDPLTQQEDSDGAGRKQVWLWAGETLECESNLEVDGLRNIGIDIRPGFRVKPRERPDHEASSSRLVPESESNQESDQAEPIRYEIGLTRRDRGSERWARTRPQHQAQRCRDREFLRLPSFTLHEIRPVPVGNPQGREQMKSPKKRGGGARVRGTSRQGVLTGARRPPFPRFPHPCSRPRGPSGVHIPSATHKDARLL